MKNVDYNSGTTENMHGEQVTIKSVRALWVYEDTLISRGLFQV